jgi:hypothetical protein
LPGFAGTSQASHWPAQAPSQHTPSTQLPLVQSALAVHALPSPFAPHEPDTHGLGAAHGSLAEQVRLQLTPSAAQL